MAKRMLVVGGFLLTCQLISMVSLRAQTPQIDFDSGREQQRVDETIDELERSKEVETQPVERPVGQAKEVQADPNELKPFRFKTIQATSTDVLNVETLYGLFESYLDRPLGPTDLEQLIAEINLLYEQADNYSSVAYIPKQNLFNDTLNIGLFEGVIGELKVSGAKQTDKDYILSWVSLKEGDKPGLKELERDLLRFNRINRSQLAARLLPGSVSGKTDLELIIAETPSDTTRFFIDNQGSRATGRYRVGVFHTQTGSLGRQEELNAYYVKAKGTDAIGASATIPLGSRGTRLNLALSRDYTKVVGGPFGSLGIVGESSSYEFGASQLLYFDTLRQLDASVAFRKQRSDSQIIGIQLQDSVTESVEFALSYSEVLPSSSLDLTLSHTRISSENLSQAEDYFGVNGLSLNSTFKLGDSWAVAGRAKAQLTSDRQVPGSQQFLIGGESSVRGYAPGLFSGHTGASVQLELRRQLGLETPELQSGIFAFVDYGLVQPLRPPNSNLPSSDKLHSVGVGFNLSYQQVHFLKMSLAVGLEEPDQRPLSKELVSLQYLLDY